MVVRATSDLHLTERSAPWVMAALHELHADAVAHGGVTVLVGDVLDQPQQVHMPTFNELRHLLGCWPGEVFVLAGNHDQYEAPRNALEALAAPNVHVISTPASTPLGRLIPYTAPELFREAVDSAVPMKGALPILWTHHGFRGAYRNAMMRDRDGVSITDVPADHLVITGHYHCPQTVGRVVYCGSPYQTTFAEEGQRKGWLRWANIRADIVPVRFAYQNVGAPSHWTIAWDPEVGPPVPPPLMQPGDKLRIKTAATRKQATAAAGQLVSAGLEGVPVMAAPDVGRDVVNITPGATPRDLAAQYVERTAGKDGSPDAAAMHAWATEVKLWGV